MKKFLCLLFILALVSAMAAQEAPKRPQQQIYKVVFLFYEMEDGKRVNERTYTLPVTTVDGSPRDSTVRVGTRVPIATASNTNDKTVWQYVDVGLSIDCNVTEQGGKFIVHGTVDLSNLAAPETGTDSKTAGNPILRQIKETFTVLVAPGKPTLVSTLDDVNSKKRFQVEVTATRIE